MGQILVKIYDIIGKDGGLPAQMRLAMKTGISSKDAPAKSDTAELVEKFKAAYKEITGKDVAV